MMETYATALDTSSRDRYIYIIRTGETDMDMMTRMDARREQMLRELASGLADLVEAGDLTAEQANEWYNAKADQWAME